MKSGSPKLDLFLACGWILDVPGYDSTPDQGRLTWTSGWSSGYCCCDGGRIRTCLICGA